MGCISSSEGRSPRFRPQSKPCKSGYLLYSDGFTKWKKVFVVLFQDSMLAWFRKPKERTPICHVTLKNVCNMLVVGPICKRIPNCPKKIPKKTSFSYMIAFPQWVTPGATGANLNSPVCFFLCPNGSTMGTWMSSMAEVLPPPTVPGSTPNDRAYPPPSAPPMNGQTGYSQPQGYSQPMVQQSHGHRRGSRGSGDFTKGFLAGAALGYGFGRPWGWGWGWGWGYHPCYGWGYADYDVDVDVDVDIDVNIEHDPDLASVSDFGGDDFQDFGDTAEAGGDGDFGLADYDAGGGDYGGGDYGGGDYSGGGDWGGGGDTGGGSWGGGGDSGGGDSGGGGGCGGGCGGD